MPRLWVSSVTACANGQVHVGFCDKRKVSRAAAPLFGLGFPDQTRQMRKKRPNEDR